MIESCRLIEEGYIPKKELNRVFEQSEYAGADIDLTFLCFEEVYFHVRDAIDKSFTIIDLGCAYAPQSYIFKNHKGYIGVDCFEEIRFTTGNAGYYTGTIESFIKMTLPKLNLDMNKTVAIVSYVPGYNTDETVKLITDTFKHYFIKYCEYQKYSDIFTKLCEDRALEE